MRGLPLVRAGAALDGPWDAIIVGAGLGGLVPAVLLARAGLRVLVLERHYVIGGLSQTFRRRRFSFEVGVHYVGDLEPGGILQRLLRAVTGRPLAVHRLPALHDRILGPGLDHRLDHRLDLRLGGDARALAELLVAVRGTDRRAIEAWLADTAYAAKSGMQHLMRRATSAAPPSEERSRAPFLRLADETLAEALERRLPSAELRSALGCLWTNYATPPEEASFAGHAATAAHYFAGAWVPEHGGDAIATELAGTFVALGGTLVVRAHVERILVDDGRAVGVRLEDGRELRAQYVVSDAGAAPTFGALLPDDAPFVDELRRRVAAIGQSHGYVGVSVGLRGSAAELGIDGANQFLLDAEPVGAFAANTAWARGERDVPGAIFVGTAASTPAAWAARHPGTSALSAGVIVPTRAFDEWSGTRHARRGDAYEARKAALGRSVLRAVARALPGIESAVEWVEVSTPLSTDHFAGRGGSFAGLSYSPRRFRLPVGPATPIPGLYLSGQDVWSTGVSGAALGGLAAASAVLRRDLSRELFFGGR